MQQQCVQHGLFQENGLALGYLLENEQVQHIALSVLHQIIRQQEVNNMGLNAPSTALPPPKCDLWMLEYLSLFADKANLIVLALFSL